MKLTSIWNEVSVAFEAGRKQARLEHEAAVAGVPVVDLNNLIITDPNAVQKVIIYCGKLWENITEFLKNGLVDAAVEVGNRLLAGLRFLAAAFDKGCSVVCDAFLQFLNNHPGIAMLLNIETGIKVVVANHASEVIKAQNANNIPVMQ